VLSQGELRDATVNFDTYQILQRHRVASLPQHGFLVHISDHSNAEITHSSLIIMAMTQNHGDSCKLQHEQNHCKRHGDHTALSIHAYVN